MKGTTKEQDAVNQIYEFAASLMVNEGKDALQVKQALMEEGLDEESAEVVIANLEQEIKAAKRESGQKDMLYGALWCIGGVVATAAEIGYIFWGAILFGGIQFFRGLFRSMS